MEITKLCIFKSILFYTTLICEAESAYFNFNPQSVTVTEGSNATFTCGSLYLSTCDYYRFSWQRKLNQCFGVEQMSSCFSATPAGRTGIVAERDGHRYRLHITNVQRDDTGTYWCSLYDPHGMRHQTSQTALLTVNPLLPQYQPSCNINPMLARVGETISLECTLSERDPPSLLTWYKSTSTGPIQTEDQTEVNPGETYPVDRVLTEADNMMDFTCIAGPDSSGPSCSITPLQISPTVSILPSHLTRHEHQNATFTCEFKSTPQSMANEYKWRVLQLDKDEIRVNIDTLHRHDGRFQLAQDGQTLEIINVTPEDFNNSQIKCIALLDDTPFPSANNSLLFVLPLSTTTPRAVTVSVTETDRDESFPDTDDNTLPKESSFIVIIVGVLGSIVFLIIITLIGCFLIKNKPNSTKPGQTAATHKQVETGGNQNDQTYDEIPLDVARDRDARMPSSATNGAEVLYACADKTRRNEIKRYAVTASSTTGEDVAVAKVESVDGEVGSALDHAIYAMPNKPAKTGNHPGKTDHHRVNLPAHDTRKETDTPIADDFESRGKNAEGLVYADLDFPRPSSATSTAVLQSDEQSEYAELRRDI
ncbi:cell adhesion molecule 2-like [Asterias amurensis]|uniref:cell adhesion molecule 2-like n=1 Tax=Asterias amurensis TaxID=7602 RepID=UPI003AB2EF9B